MKKPSYMTVWMLSQFAPDPMPETWPSSPPSDFPAGGTWPPKGPVASAYADGYECLTFPTPPETWALVLCNASPNQVEAAALDPRVQPYHTVYGPLTPETVTAYAAYGAQPGMMLCQLLHILAQKLHAAYGHM